MIFPQMLSAISSHLPKVHEHPFNVGLNNGTLPKSVFNVFLAQDKKYLIKFSEILSKTAKRLTDTKHQQLFDKLSKYVLETEWEHFSSLPIDDSVNIIPSVTAYIKHLEKMAHDDAPVTCSVASLLPCFYLYGELGTSMLKKGVNEQNPYRFWVALYSDKDFLSYGKKLIEITEELASKLDIKEQQTMISAFVTSTEHEIGFWDSVYEGEKLTTKSTQINGHKVSKL